VLYRYSTRMFFDQDMLITTLSDKLNIKKAKVFATRMKGAQDITKQKILFGLKAYKNYC
jgi:hypothetical protein